jgi:hypothetical protein
MVAVLAGKYFDQYHHRFPAEYRLGKVFMIVGEVHAPTLPPSWSLEKVGRRNGLHRVGRLWLW